MLANGDAPRADYGPSLPKLLGPRLRALRPWQRVALALVVAALAAAAVALFVRSEAATRTYHQAEADAARSGLPAIPFHFDHSRRLELSKPDGAYVEAEREIGGRLVSRFTVSPLEIGPERGLLSGFMPIVATRYERQAAREHDGFRLQFEGRARVNEVEGYQFAFTGRLPRPGLPPRQLFGRVVLLPEPFDIADPEKPYPDGRAPRRGLILTMLATSLDNVPSATRVGDEGILQRPFRSFRFGS